MSARTGRYLEIPEWRTLQHYTNRALIWLKLPLRALPGGGDWLDLSLIEQATLVGVWRLTAERGRWAPDDPAWLAQRIAGGSRGGSGGTVSCTRRSLATLKTKGLLVEVDSNLIDQSRAEGEKKRKRKPPNPPPPEPARTVSPEGVCSPSSGDTSSDLDTTAEARRQATDALREAVAVLPPSTSSGSVLEGVEVEGVYKSGMVLLSARGSGHRADLKRFLDGFGLSGYVVRVRRNGHRQNGPTGTAAVNPATERIPGAADPDTEARELIANSVEEIRRTLAAPEPGSAGKGDPPR